MCVNLNLVSPSVGAIELPRKHADARFANHYTDHRYIGAPFGRHNPVPSIFLTISKQNPFGPPPSFR